MQAGVEAIEHLTPAKVVGFKRHLLEQTDDQTELLCGRLAVNVVEDINGVDSARFSTFLMREVGAVSVRCYKVLESALADPASAEWPSEQGVPGADQFYQVFQEINPQRSEA